MTPLVPPGSAFLPGPRVTLPPLRAGPLNDLTFAAKDLLDVSGHQKTAGNPDWARTHPPAKTTAPVIDRLRDAGAWLVGKTITDELAFSLEGENIHYGTPLNPRCPDRLPGGSSSGSASAVAGGLVDFALGTDTGGSIRVPSSFCGLFGMRPTHGTVPLEGVTPLAPSIDVVGWMARDGRLLARVGEVLLGEATISPPAELRVVVDAFELMEPRARVALEARLAVLFPAAGSVRLFDGQPQRWTETFQAVRGGEAWAIHGPWIQEVRPHFAPEIAERFDRASRFTAAQVEGARKARRELAERVGRYLGPTRALLLPSSPSVALPKDRALRRTVGTRFRESALTIGSIAGLGGFPQVTLPIAAVDGCPIGLGVLGARGSDRSLLGLAASPRVQELIA